MRSRLVLTLALAMMAMPSVTFGSERQPPTIGFLHSGSLDRERTKLVESFRGGLSEAGFVEGANVKIDYLWAENDPSKLSSFASELVQRRVAVIVTGGGVLAALAAKAATSTTPIVFSVVVDPVRNGLVKSLRDPGANITGTAGLTSELDAKRLELLIEAVPTVRSVAVLVNPARPGFEGEWLELRRAAETLGVPLVMVSATRATEIASAVEQLPHGLDKALLITADPLFFENRSVLVEAARRRSLPALYFFREFASEGGLISYGAKLTDIYRRSGLLAGRIIKGERPADLPVEQPSKFETIINLKTARELGLPLSPSLLARADEVIE
jgi:putative ABC transport system substrate-binding protein